MSLTTSPPRNRFTRRQLHVCGRGNPWQPYFIELGVLIEFTMPQEYLLISLVEWCLVYCAARQWRQEREADERYSSGFKNNCFAEM